MHYELNYINEGNGIPIVLQHGLGSNVAQSKKLLGDLSDIQLIALDCPGHGASPYPADRSPSFDYYVEEVIRLVDRLGVEQAYFGGISMGSGIAVNVALAFPERVKGLILVRPAWLDTPTPDNLKILLDAAKYIPKADGQAAFEQLSAFRQIKNKLPTAAQSVLGVFADTQQKEIPQVLTHLVNDAPFPSLKKIQTITQPCIILANDDDPLHPFEMAQVIHQHINGSTLHKVTSRYIDDNQHRIEVQKIVSNFLQ